MANCRAKWRFQFHLRTLLAAVAVLGAVCAYVANEANAVRDRELLLAEVVRSGGGYVTLDIDGPLISYGPNDFEFMDLSFGYLPTFGYPRTGWSERHAGQAPSKIRRWLGDSVVSNIFFSIKSFPAQSAMIKAHFPEANLIEFDP